MNLTQKIQKLAELRGTKIGHLEDQIARDLNMPYLRVASFKRYADQEGPKKPNTIKVLKKIEDHINNLLENETRSNTN